MLLSNAIGPAQRRVAAFILAAAAAAILGALAFEHLGSLAPCPLCLRQRLPYYLGIPLAAVALALAWHGRHAKPTRLLLLALGGLFLYAAGLGVYHSGVEWGFWPGPADCAADAGAAPTSASDLLSAMQGTRIVPCDEAAWRFLGLSLAGYNALIATALAGLALWAAVARPYGSSTASQ